MQAQSSTVAEVVSSAAYDQILTSRYLRAKMLPEGRMVSPYEVLGYRGTLRLVDPGGRRAVFRRSQRVRFLQEGVSSILDHFWGDGVSLTHYRHSAGQLADSFRDGDRHHLAIDLMRPMHRGEVLAFDVERMAMVSFSSDHEWLETIIDHPIRHLTQRIIFPPERSCQYAELVADDQVMPLRSIGLKTGGTILKFNVPRPQADTPYLVRWRW